MLSTHTYPLSGEEYRELASKIKYFSKENKDGANKRQRKNNRCNMQIEQLNIINLFQQIS